MGKLNPLAILAIVVDFLLLGICLSHVPSVASRPRVPFGVSEGQGRLVVDEILDVNAARDLRIGDQIESCNSRAVHEAEYFEFAADIATIGDPVEIGYRRGGTVSSTQAVLIPCYPTAQFVITTEFVGLAFWVIGLFILFSRPNDHAGRMLHWSIVLMAATLMMTQGSVVPSQFYSLFSRSVLLLVYPLMGAIFLYFSTLFPQSKLGSRALKALVIVTPAVVLSGIMIALFLGASATGDPDQFQKFQISYDCCHSLLAVYGLGTIVSMIYSYTVARTKEERRKLQWIMWGSAIGPTPFILLIIVPQLLFSTDFVSEEYATLFLIVVPFALAISFLKYQVMDIGILISRSIVYFVLTVFVGAIYLAAALLLASAVGGARISREYFLVVIVSLLIAVLLNPLRIRLQRFVDSTLFPARSKFREAVREISTELHRMISTDQLFAGVGNIVQRYLPVSAVGVYNYSDGKMTLDGIQPPDLIPRFQLSEEHAREIALPKVYASSSAVNFRRNDIDTTKEHLLSKLGFSVGLPLLSESGRLLGMLVASPRAETKRFDEGEIDLLSTIGHQSEEALERLKLQEEFILEREGKKHAEELNALKSYFVSSVSHELRTPLTSIRMFADTLKDRKLAGTRTYNEYLNIIIGETERLGRLINNILDFSKIEQGLKEFHFEQVNFLRVVKKSVAAMQYQVHMEGASLKLTIPRQVLKLWADADALQEVIMNLLSNALKYSTRRKEIRLTVHKCPKTVEFAVADKGLGIAEKDLPHIFEQFFRVKDERSRQVGGVGLGLSVVKHIIEAHKGTISVTSTLGAGTTFTVRLPLMNSHENDPRR